MRPRRQQVGAGNCRPSRGWIHQPVRLRDAGGWGWDRRLSESPWTEKRGAVVGRTLEVVAQWPGMTLDMARQALSETLGGRSAQRSCLDLMERGFIDRVRDRGKYRYMITTRGVDCIARRDRVHYSHCKDRIDSLSWVGRPSRRAHEDGVMSFISHFLAVGLPAAAGWRSWEHLGGSGGISPDGLVFLERSPFGPPGLISSTSAAPGVKGESGASSTGTRQTAGGTGGLPWWSVGTSQWRRCSGRWAVPCGFRC